MLSLILSLISPILKIFTSIFGDISNTKIAEVQADTTVRTTEINAVASVERTWWFVALALFLFALIFVIYDAKAVLWDNIIMGGTTSTPELRGNLGLIHLTVVGGLFMHSLVRRV